MKPSSKFTAGIAALLAYPFVFSTAIAQDVPEAKSFDQTDGVLERARAVEDIEYKIMVQRATQAAIYYMPAVVMVDFVKAVRRDLDGDLNDVAFLNAPLGSDDGFLTANDVTAYCWSSLSSENGPVVVEVPPASEKVSYFGSILNAWSQPIEDVGPAGKDKGEGGKYLLLPPGYKGEKSKEALEKEGYFVYQTDTYEYGFSFRPRLYKGGTDKDAGDYAKGVKIYYLSEAANPPATKYLDATEKSYDCLPYYNFTFFEDLDHVVQNNPIRPQDKGIYSLLKEVGIQKGKEFKPTERQKQAIHEGLLLAYASMQKYFVTPGKSMEPLWKDKDGKPKTQWMFWLFAPGQAEAGFPHETETEVLVDDRAAKYFYVTYLPRYLGGGTFYLTGLFDSEGNKLDGNSTYKLNVPKDTPAKDFWSVIVYSMETKNFVRDVPRVGLSSRNADTMKANTDGSYDVYFAPEAPEGKEANWIPTGEDFFLLFRLYGPDGKDWFKNWMLGDLKKVD